LTPVGENMLYGIYACYGCTIGNSDLLERVKEGDVADVAKDFSKLEIVEYNKFLSTHAVVYYPP
jgi:hypothetical protein